MKKIHLIATILILLILSSCVLPQSIKSSNVFDNNKNKEIVETALKELDKFIQKDNAEAIKKMFTKSAQSVDTIDQDIKNLIDFYEGELTTIKGTTTISSITHKSKGKTETKLTPTLEIQTTKQKYYIWFLYYSVNTINPQEKGFNSFGIIRAENWNYPYDYALKDKWEIPGIFVDTTDYTSIPEYEFLESDY